MAPLLLLNTPADRPGNTMLLMVSAILTQIIALLVTLTMLVFLMAGGANSTPSQLRFLKRTIWVTLLIGLAGLAACVVMLIQERNGLACLLSLLPIAWCLGLFLWMLLTGAPRREPSPPGDGW